MSVTPRYARMSNYGHPCSNFNKQANTAILNALIQSEAFQFLIEHTLMSLVIWELELQRKYFAKIFMQLLAY